MEQQDLGDAFAEFTDEAAEWVSLINPRGYGTNPVASPEGEGSTWEYPPDPPEATWRIWSNVYHQWFLPQASGYTPDVKKSGRFMPREALAIYENAARGWDPALNAFPISITLVPAS